MTDILPDVLEHGLTLVFCGTAASEASARAGAYYANRSNAFWRTLHKIGLTPRLFAPAEFCELRCLGIGLTDVAKYAFGSDRVLRRVDFQAAALTKKVAQFQPQMLAFTSKTAWRAWRELPATEAVSYGPQDGALERTRIFVLPSPSGAARRYWDVQPWQDLADEYHRLRS